VIRHLGQDGLAAYLLTKRSPVRAGDDVEEDRGGQSRWPIRSAMTGNNKRLTI